MTRLTRTAPKAASTERSIDVSARVIKRAEASTSRQQPLPVEHSATLTMAGSGIPIPTPHDVETLYRIIEQSSSLMQCIDAYVVNTVESGWEVGPVTRGSKMKAVEQDELQSFIDRANAEESLATVVSKAERDKESVGFGFIEAIRDTVGNISILRHASSLTMRLTALHPQEQRIEYEIPRGKRKSVVVEFKKFRKYVQIVNGVTVYFKEFGDPRKMNSVTGLFEGESGFENKDLATEIIHLRLPSNDPYGLPRWIGQTPNLIGTREAEEVNMRFFENNMIPPVMITVAGGRLTAASFKEIQKVLNTGTGKDRQNAMILIEAVGDGDSVGDKASPVQIKVDKLASERPSDGLFKEYVDGNSDKARSSWRLPPVVVGMSQDATFATANVSQFVAETQVFAPARQRNDEVLNNLIVNGRNGLHLTSVKLVARTPSISSPEAVIKSLTALNVMGAVTPRSAQKVANAMLQMELPEYPEKGQEGYEEWMDMPMPLAIKEAGAAAGVGDPNAQSDHTTQNAKDAGTKAVEDSGDISMKSPEHGQE